VPGLAKLYKGSQILLDNTGGGIGRGFNIAALDPKTFTVVAGGIATFDTYITRDSGTDMENMIAFLNGLPNGTIILIAVADEAGLTLAPFEGNPCTVYQVSSVQQGLQTLQSLGSQQIGNYCYQNSWAMITVKGQGVALSEQLSNSSIVTAQASVTKQ
jgi:Interleukin-like EMT inducer